MSNLEIHFEEACKLKKYHGAIRVSWDKRWFVLAISWYWQLYGICIFELGIDYVCKSLESEITRKIPYSVIYLRTGVGNLCKSSYSENWNKGKIL
jgi:hypothetical protein